VPIIGRTGLIILIGRRSSAGALKVAANLSPRQFH
jgi:hypothetical protein